MTGLPEVLWSLVLRVGVSATGEADVCVFMV